MRGCAKPQCLKARRSQSEPNRVSNAPRGKLEVRRRQGLSLSTSARVGEMSPFKQGPLRLREGAQNRPTIQARLGRRLACDDEPSLWVEGSDSPSKYGSSRKRFGDIRRVDGADYDTGPSHCSNARQQVVEARRMAAVWSCVQIIDHACDCSVIRGGESRITGRLRNEDGSSTAAI